MRIARWFLVMPLFHGLGPDRIAALFGIASLARSGRKLVNGNLLALRDTHLAMKLTLLTARMKILRAPAVFAFFAGRRRPQSRS